MAFHIETFINDSIEHRAALGGDTVEAAIRSAQNIIDKVPTPSARILEAPGDNVGFGNGTVVAEYKSGNEPEWTLLP